MRGVVVVLGACSSFGCASLLDSTDATFQEESPGLITVLKAPKIEQGAHFGDTLAFDGHTAVIGASFASQGGLKRAGAAYVFERSGRSWTSTTSTTLTIPSPTANAGDLPDSLLPSTIPGNQLPDFPGMRAALNDKYIAISFVASDVAGSKAGLVCIYERAALSRPAKCITSPNPHPEDLFGAGLALSSNRLAVGAPRESGFNGTRATGAVYVFGERDGNFEFEWRVTAPTPQKDALFGLSVVLTDDTLVVGAPTQSDTLSASAAADAGPIEPPEAVGAVYVFKRTDTLWVDTGVVKPPAAQKTFFGTAMVLSEGKLAVGAPGAPGCGESTDGGLVAENEFSPGAVYVFDANTLEQQSCYSPPRYLGGFGFSVATVANRLIVGLPFDAETERYSGAVCWLALDDAGRLSRPRFHKSPSIHAGDFFSGALAGSSDLVLIGAPGDPGQSKSSQDVQESGAVYVFDAIY